LDIVTAENQERLAGVKEAAFDPNSSFVKIKERTASYLFGDKPKVSKDGTGRVSQLIHAFKKTGYDNPANFPRAPEVCRKLTADQLSFDRPSSWEQFGLLFKRNSQNFYRSKLATVARIMIAIIMGVIAGTIFLKTTVTPSGIADRTGALFTIMLGCSVSVANNVVAVFPVERSVFLREYRSGTYNTLPYYVSKVITEIPMQIVVPIVQGSLLYWLADLNHDAGRYFTFLLVLVTLTLISTGIGLWISCAVESAFLAGVIVSPVLVLIMFLAGFLRTDANLPNFWGQLKYASFFRYCYFILVCNEFEGEAFSCPNGACAAPSGNEYLKNVLHYDCTLKWPFYIVMVGFYLFFTTLGFVFLNKRAKK